MPTGPTMPEPTDTDEGPDLATWEGWIALLEAEGFKIGDCYYSESDVASGLHWWLVTHHKGQGSDEYAALSDSPYSPGACETGPDGETACEVFDALCSDQGCPNPNSGYHDCPCRDCFEIAIGGTCRQADLCSACEESGCDPSGDRDCECPPEDDESDSEATHGQE